jgi:hypothetical protein
MAKGKRKKFKSIYIEFLPCYGKERVSLSSTSALGISL